MDGDGRGTLTGRMRIIEASGFRAKCLAILHGMAETDEVLTIPQHG